MKEVEDDFPVVKPAGRWLSTEVSAANGAGGALGVPSDRRMREARRVPRRACEARAAMPGHPTHADAEAGCR